MVDPLSMGPVRGVEPRASAPAAAAAASSAVSAAAPAHQTQIVAAKDDAARVTPSLPQLVSLATELANQGPPVDYARLASIRQAIAMGSYRTDPEAIARAMTVSQNAINR